MSIPTPKRMQFLIPEWEQEERESKASVDRQFLIENIITPVLPEPSQRAMLAQVLGRETVDYITAVTAFDDMGLLEHSCPRNLDEVRDKYTVRYDPYTGRTYCRLKESFALESIVENPEVIETIKSEQPAMSTCDTRINSIIKRRDGTYDCVQRIMRGEYKCPTLERPSDTKLYVLRDGTGICVPNDSIYGEPQLYATELGSEPLNMDKIGQFLTVYNQIKLNSLASISYLNGIYRTFSPEILIERLSNHAYLRRISELISTDEDKGLANIALYLHGREMNLIPSTYHIWNKFFNTPASSEIGDSKILIYSSAGGGIADLPTAYKMSSMPHTDGAYQGSQTRINELDALINELNEQIEEL